LQGPACDRDTQTVGCPRAGAEPSRAGAEAHRVSAPSPAPGRCPRRRSPPPRHWAFGVADRSDRHVPGSASTRTIINTAMFRGWEKEFNATGVDAQVGEHRLPARAGPSRFR